MSWFVLIAICLKEISGIHIPDVYDRDDPRFPPTEVNMNYFTPSPIPRPGSFYPHGLGGKMAKAEPFELYDMEEKITRAGKWPEFIARLHKKQAKLNGALVDPNWEDDVYDWAAWIKSIDVKTETTTTKRPLLRIADQIPKPSPGMDMYWGHGQNFPNFRRRSIPHLARKSNVDEVEEWTKFMKEAKKKYADIRNIRNDEYLDTSVALKGGNPDYNTVWSNYGIPQKSAPYQQYPSPYNKGGPPPPPPSRFPPKKEYASPSPQSGYAPPSQQTGYAPPQSQREYAPPPPQRGYAPPPPQREYAPPPPQRQYAPPPAQRPPPYRSPNFQALLNQNRGVPSKLPPSGAYANPYPGQARNPQPNYGMQNSNRSPQFARPQNMGGYSDYSDPGLYQNQRPRPAQRSPEPLEYSDPNQMMGTGDVVDEYDSLNPEMKKYEGPGPYPPRMPYSEDSGIPNGKPAPHIMMSPGYQTSLGLKGSPAPRPNLLQKKAPMKQEEIFRLEPSAVPPDYPGYEPKLTPLQQHEAMFPSLQDEYGQGEEDETPGPQPEEPQPTSPPTTTTPEPTEEPAKAEEKVEEKTEAAVQESTTPANQLMKMLEKRLQLLEKQSMPPVPASSMQRSGPERPESAPPTAQDLYTMHKLGPRGSESSALNYAFTQLEKVGNMLRERQKELGLPVHYSELDRALSKLPKKDDFNAPVRWVPYHSEDAEEGFARVTDPQTGKNQQYTINGTIYVPVIDYSVQRLKETFPENEGVPPPPMYRRSIPDEARALRTVISNVDMKQPDYKDWLVLETVHSGVNKGETMCDADSCHSRCNTPSCQTMCQGDSCQSGCIGDGCYSMCHGEGCSSMCVGKGCIATCDGLSCDARCRGTNCNAQCEKFSCYFTINGDFYAGQSSWDENYPQYGQAMTNARNNEYVDD